MFYLHEGKEYEEKDREKSSQIFPGCLQGQDEDREPVVEAKQLDELQDAHEQDQAGDLQHQQVLSFTSNSLF
jgi:hypothetical protein